MSTALDDKKSSLLRSSLINIGIILAFLLTMLLCLLAIGAAKADADVRNTPAVLRTIAANVEAGGEDMPGDTLVKSTFNASGNISYNDPETGNLQNSRTMTVLGFGYQYKVEGTLDAYTVTAEGEKRGKLLKFTYDSTTGEVVQTTEEEGN